MNRAMAQAWLVLAGALHFLQIPSMLYLRRGLALERDLRRLTPLNARLVRLFIAAVMLLLLGLGASAVLQPSAWLDVALGRTLALLLGCFWLARAVSQAWLRPEWPRGPGNRALLYGLWSLYAFLALSYGAVFAAGPFGASAAQRKPCPTCPSAGSSGKR